MKTLVRRTSAAGPIGALSPLLSRLYSARGIDDERQVDHQLKYLCPPDSMKGLAGAAALLGDVMANERTVTIVGDFDADGATSCALMVLGLTALGASRVNYLVPNRFEFGYGLTPEIVEVARQSSPDLLVTVDNGISSVAGVEAARAHGIRVLITDHHLPGSALPPADAIVNPNQPGCRFPSKCLAGVGVAFYLLSALRQYLRTTGWFEARGIAEPNLAHFLDLVALGTIADVVPLDYNNRILAQEGIRRMRAGRARPGLLALADVAGANYPRLVARDLAFGVAPRLNAAGRLEDMSLGIECLLTDDPERAMELAGRLDALNRERRAIEDEMRRDAQSQLALGDIATGEDSVGVCLFRDDWHQGVVGIVASRIKDQIHRPVIAFARGDPGQLKGSARSIAGLHVRDALDAIAARYPGLLVKFGGHAMAAGVTLKESDFTRFAQAFDDEARRWLGADQLAQMILSDGDIDVAIDLPLAREITGAAPWGQGFDEPLFDSEFEIIEQRIVGGHHLKLKLRHGTTDSLLDAIAFNHESLLEGRYRRLAYRVDINEYRGSTSVQLIIEATEFD